MKPEYLERLEEELKTRPHIVSEKMLPHKTWVKLKQPYTWIETPVAFEDIEVFTDVSYRLHAIFINGQFDTTFRDQRVISHKDDHFMIADGPSYGMDAYAAIFKLVAK